jgi:hypothetical protein
MTSIRPIRTLCRYAACIQCTHALHVYSVHIGCIHALYNHIRPHQALSGKTPAEVAGLETRPVEDEREMLKIAKQFIPNSWITDRFEASLRG